MSQHILRLMIRVYQHRAGFVRGACLALVGMVVLPGCNDPDSGAFSASYGQPRGEASTSIPRLNPMDPQTRSWTNADFAVVRTELSPAFLIHSKSSFLSLFRGMTNYGLGSPTHVAFSSRSGPRSFPLGEPLPVVGMEENWMIAWFGGGEGWEKWDAPWAVFLQHKPIAMILDGKGMRLQFRQAAGDVVLMPLYGYFKPPVPGYSFQETNGLPATTITPELWQEVLPTDLLMRVRYWASATRQFPLYCEDSFHVDRSRDSVTIRQTFQWHSIEDDWSTRSIKLAPLSPPLAMVVGETGFPVTLSEPFVDFDMVTPSGPYLGVQGKDSYEATFKVLQYVNETEKIGLTPTNDHPVVAAALTRLRAVVGEQFAATDRLPSSGELPHATARSLPFMEPATREMVLSELARFFREEVLVTNRFQFHETPPGSGHVYALMLDDVAEGDVEKDRVLGPAAKRSANLLETLWTYAHYSGDWALIRERWPLIRQLYTHPVATRWAGFGRDDSWRVADHAAPCLAFARLAYQAGDMDSYHYACYQFARELVHLFIQHRGTDYFLKQQPWHSLAVMTGELYPTSLTRHGAGWDLEGPDYPNQGENRGFEERWVQFRSEDVARFYRDYLPRDIRWEMKRLTAHWKTNQPPLEAMAFPRPSLMSLRSLLLNEAPAELTKLKEPDPFSGTPAETLANCLALLRSASPPETERLIPPGSPLPFITGLERDVAGPYHELTQVIHEPGQMQGPLDPLVQGWPRVDWWNNWRTPSGAVWNFGHIITRHSGPALPLKETPLNWNTSVLVFEGD